VIHNSEERELVLLRPKAAHQLYVLGSGGVDDGHLVSCLILDLQAGPVEPVVQVELDVLQKGVCSCKAIVLVVELQLQGGHLLHHHLFDCQQSLGLVEIPPMHRGEVGVGQLGADVVVELDSRGGAHDRVLNGGGIQNMTRVQRHQLGQGERIGCTVRELAKDEQRI